ncbi:polysaccharide export outer membrane protein [Parvibaculum indicum]|uniref:polysaccharide biosynthesis/export family protein n=1 Tax=Parvibaculum indicum TaxID=562969 RepID=UPI001964CFB5|nr:polysaccharide biosynthesis/export family protein [Parvibaculum indicum]NIJ41613.1 polysaccharide export outer membrane protein [Parvibaculum indicum]
MAFRGICHIITGKVAMPVLRALTLSITLAMAGFVVAAPAQAQDNQPAAAPASTGTAASSEVHKARTLDYRLGSGDKLRVIVFGEEDLSGEFDVTGAGMVSLPLIGQVRAQGLTVDEFENAIRNKLLDGYLKNPRVSVEVLNYRPFYIIGEVNSPGQYPYTSGMTVLNAVAVAAGYTYRANEDRVYITRGDGEEEAYAADQTVKVLPGDVIRVPERFF